MFERTEIARRSRGDRPVSSVGCQHPSARDTSVLAARRSTWSDQPVRTAALLAQAQLRRGWRNLVGLSLLIALVGGLVLAGLAGAERTRTAVDRMVSNTEPFDVLINPSDGDASRLDYDAVAELPMVADMSRMSGVGAFSAGPYESIEELFSAPLIMATDGGSTLRFDRPILSAGRVPSPDSLDEILVERNYAASEDLDVGDTMTLRIFPPAVLGEAFEALDAGDFETGFAILSDPSAGTTVDMRVAGIGTWIDGIVVDEGYEPVTAWMGPAMYESLGSPSAGFGGAVVRLRDPDATAEFAAAVDALAPDEKIVYQTQEVSVAKAIRSTQPAATALVIFAVVTAVLGLLLVGQAISRRVQLDALDNDTLAAIGATRPGTVRQFDGPTHAGHDRGRRSGSGARSMPVGLHAGRPGALLPSRIPDSASIRRSSSVGCSCSSWLSPSSRSCLRGTGRGCRIGRRAHEVQRSRPGWPPAVRRSR